MNQRRVLPYWRGSLGLLVTVIAAVLLLFAIWKAYSLGNAAGGDLPTLNRERIAVAYDRLLYPLLLDGERYQLQMLLLGKPPFDPGLRARVDADMSAAAQFGRTRGAELDGAKTWAVVESRWKIARAAKRLGPPLPVYRFNIAILDFIYKIEDTSGLEYDTDRYTQDLADMTFAKLPSAADDVLRGSLLAQNAQMRGTLAIPDRVHFSNLLSAMPSDFDLGPDDWTMLLAWLPGGGIANAAQAKAYGAAAARYKNSGYALHNRLYNGIVLRAVPSGTPAQTHAAAAKTLSAVIPMNAGLQSLLDRVLAVREGYVRARTRYIFAVILFGALMLVGIILLVAELTARRERDALQTAQQESARLTAELARQNAERALRLSEAQFRAIFDGAAVGIAILDRNARILDANGVFRAVYGENAAGLLGEHTAQFAELMRGERDLFEYEQHVMTPDGHEAFTDATISLVNDDAGQPYFAICMFRDMTALKYSERRMLHDLTHDALTGLPNRSLFERTLRERFAETQSSPEYSFAVLIVDFDRFKDINESLGHDAGDFVISQVAGRIRAVIDAQDIVARLSGDEFAVLLASLTDVLHVEVVARRVLGALTKPVSVGERSIFVSASVGIALSSNDYARGEDVMRDADIAMRYAKGAGGSRFSVFDSKMHARAEKRLQLTTDLRLALESHEFALLYQPIVRLSDGHLVGCEALLRWDHPVEGRMYPADFMPLAEQTGLAVPIGRYVLETACTQLAAWKRMASRPMLPMNVNVSAAELLDPEFENVLLRIVRDCGVDPAELTLEITESVVLDAGTRPNAIVARLRRHGFNICIDDFGTGYSSLRYLQQFDVDTIKIDRSFVCGPDGEVASEPIVRTLITLAEAFDVRVVAEGIETQRQCDVLRNAGCRLGQGYLFARAMGAQELAAMYPAVFGLTPKHASA